MNAASLTPWQKVLDSEYSCAPCRPGELPEFYWQTGFKTTEIMSAFALVGHSSVLVAKVGPARLVGCECNRCAGHIHLFSRAEAAERVKDLREEQWHAADWADPRICKECKRELYDARHASALEAQKAYDRRRNELRFMPYGEYLKTPEWARTRQDALRRARHKCQTCSGGGELHVHHRTYARRGCEYSTDLTVLCAGCHDLFHKNARLAEDGRAPLNTNSLRSSQAANAGTGTPRPSVPAPIQARPS